MADDPLFFTATWHDQSPADLLTQVGEWAERHSPELAVSYYEAALCLDPEFGLAAWRAGQFYLREKRFAEAIESFHKALASSPDQMTLYKLGSAYTGAGEYERGLDFSNQSLAINGKNPSAVLQRMRCLVHLERWADLAASYEEFEPIVAPSDEALLWRALAMAQLRRFREAVSFYNLASNRAKRQHTELSRRIEEILRAMSLDELMEL